MKYYIQMMCLMGLLLTGCSDAQDDIEQVIGDEGCRVSIRVGASDNVETKAGDDPNALAGEFINELCVFVVDDQGTIEQKFQASSTDPNGTFTDDPSTGDAYEWRSNEFVLPAGKKTIYAFANWGTVNNTSWNTIINKSVGGTLSDADLGIITIEDPAGKVDLTSETNKKFIPMSVKQAVNVTVDQTIRVELVRLVGRVNIQLTNSKASSVTVTSFTMGQFANKVALMPDGTATDVAYELVCPTSFESLTINGGESKTFQFYVNETKNANATTGFPIDLETTDNKNYSAKTEAKAIPRNNILPLNLTISESDLNLVVTAYIAPIGGYPVQVYTSNDLIQAAAYSVTLPEGCTFQVTGKLADGTEGTCVLSYDGTTDQNENIEIDAANKSMAYVTALPGLVAAERDITRLKVSFKVGDVVRATCTLNVSTEALKDWGEGGYPITRTLTQWGEAPRWYEIVPMMQKNP